MKNRSSKHTFFCCLSITVILFLPIPFLCTGANRVIHLGNNDGLSNSAVNAAFQDTHGLMWFGTWDGLNRYDGTEFVTFRPHYNDSACISNHIIRKIFEENKEFLWITTDYGINRLDKLTGTFKQYYLGYKNRGTFREHSFLATRSSKGSILATAFNTSFYLFNPIIADFIPVNIKGIKPGNITQLFFDFQDCLWVVNDRKEIQRITFKKRSSQLVDVLKIEKFFLPNIQKISYDQTSRVWIQQNDHLYYYITSDPILHLHSSDIYLPGELNDVLNTKENYFFATTTGLVNYNIKKQTSDIQFKGISILSLCKGTQNILWAGTDTKGIFKILPQKQYFKAFTKEQLPELGNHATRAIYKDIDNNLWVGTKGGGLIKISFPGVLPGLQKAKKFSKADGLINNSVLSMASATHQNFWIGTDGNGINYYSYAQKNIKKLNGKLPTGPDGIYSVYALLQTQNSTLWVGTSGNGLFKLTILENKDKNEYLVTGYKHYIFKSNESGSINSNIIYSLVNEGDSVLWIATRGGGLNKLNIHSGIFTSFKSIPNAGNTISSNDVICLFRDSNQHLWIGTGAGLNLMIREKGNRIMFKRYTESNGLANNNIHGIIEDSQHNIWISSSKGLSRINTEHETVTNYLYDDGLQDNEFSDGAFFSTSNRHELYFGGINGFNIIHPNEIGLSNYNPPLYLSSFKVDNIIQPLSSDYSKERIISYHSNSLSFHFSVLDYIANQKCKMAYTLILGRDNWKVKDDNEWINIGTIKDIILSNLTHGHYKLLVKYSNSDNKWSEHLFVFPFRVTAPWWQTGYAYFFYSIIFILICYLAFCFQRYRMRMEHSLKLEKLEEQKKEEIHQAKLRFFTNIAHEFSNSITLIYGSCERVLEHHDLNEKDKKHLFIVKRNAERMKNQIQQLMEFRKAETGYLSLHLEQVDVSEMIKYTLDNFLDLADSKKINLSLKFSSDTPEWISDRDILEKVIFNLFSNAFKYTPVNGTITISLDITEQGELRFCCTNSGVGIKPEDQSAIFNRFKVLDNFETQLSQGLYTRNGIGLAVCQSLVKLLNGNILVDSKVDEYTTFTVLLPQGTIQEQNNVSDKNKYPLLAPNVVISVSEGNNKKVLVVDDQPDIHLLIDDILTPQYTVLRAMNGIEALDIIADQNPALIICDIIMPEMDGITLLKELKKMPETSHIPVVLLSSKASIESQIEGLEIGANMFIGKPFHPAHLKAAVDSILGNKEIIREYLESPQAYSEQYNGNLIDKADKGFIDKIIYMLSENLDNEDYNQDALSGDMAISRVQLYRKIKKIANRTPADFIRNYRLQEAEKLIKKTSKTVSEIMCECGFRNKAYFYREFAKIYHCTPKEYRNTINGENKDYTV